jgi:hypothetical protein
MDGLVGGGAPVGGPGGTLVGGPPPGVTETIMTMTSETIGDGAGVSGDNGYNEVLAHNQCGCGVSCKKQCGSGCCTKRFKIHGCITVDEEIERCEKSGEKSCNDGRFYKTMECAHVVDANVGSNPIMDNAGMSYNAGEAPDD